MTQREQEFLEYVQSGGQVEAGDSMPDDYRTKLIKFIEMHGNSELMGVLPELPEQAARAARAAAEKGWRWIGEMEEIASAFDAAGLPDGLHRAAADIYRATSTEQWRPGVPS